MKHARRFVVPLMLLLSALPLYAQRHRDPLTDAETDQLREVADQPEERMKLWVKFVRARMVAFDQFRSDPKFAPDRGKRLHDILEDLTAMVDEVDDNIDNFSKQKADIRKGLKLVVEMDSELQLKLRALKEADAADPTVARTAGDYKFVLDNAIDSVNQSAENARSTLQEQNEEFAKKGKEKKK